MKLLRVILYIAAGLFLALLALIGAAAFLDHIDPPGAPGLTQTMSVGGKTVHAVMKGAYSMTNDGNDVIVNGKKLDLSGGDEFTVEINADGTTTVRPGKP